MSAHPYAIKQTKMAADRMQVQSRRGVRRQQGEEGDWHSGEESGRLVVARTHA